MDIKLQPSVNIAVFGHVANGKTTTVERLTKTDTRRHSNEQKKNHTLKLGYANAKIYKCDGCDHHDATPSSVFNMDCKECHVPMTLIRHISFIDCPGHHTLMAKMLASTRIADSAIIMEAISNAEIPSQQTVEHIIAAEIMAIDCKFACMNKLDLGKKFTARNKIQQFSQYLEQTSYKDIPIIPMSASMDINIDVLCEHIAKLIPEPKRDLDSPCRMIVVRSFNINKQYIPIKDMVGAVLGGSIIEGKLCVGDKISVCPGVITMDNDEPHYKPLVGTVVSMKSEQNELSDAYPGGLIAVQTTIDPSLGTQDKLSGNMIFGPGDSEDYSVYHEIDISYKMVTFDDDTKHKVKLGDNFIINHNSSSNKVTVIEHDRKSRRLVAKINDMPICAKEKDIMSISKLMPNGVRLIGMGQLETGKALKKAQ